MRDPKDVIAAVVNGKGPELAGILEVSVSRCNEILSTDNPYPKTKRLIRAIAQVNRPGISLIKADMDALFTSLLEESGPVSLTELHKELGEPVQAALDEKPVAEQHKELLETISVASRRLRDLDGFQPFSGQPVSFATREVVIETVSKNGRWSRK